MKSLRKFRKKISRVLKRFLKLKIDGARINFWKKVIFKQGSKPNFLIVGVSKSGTTSLYNYLVQHSLIEPAYHKEIFYFYFHRHNLFGDHGKREKNDAWYKAHFAPEEELKKTGKITGEATPIYLFYKEAAREIKEFIPNGRFIVLLRNPVDRLFSHYKMRSNSKHRKLGTFEEELEDLLSNGLQKGLGERGTWIDLANYVEQLENWFEVFPDKSQTLVIKSEDFFEDTEETFRKVCQHLNIPYEKVNFRAKRVGKYKDDVNPETRRRLEEIFSEHNRKLKEMVGFNWD